MTRPQLSAICVSHPSRWGLLQRAILNFLEQTDVPNRELIIVLADTGYFQAVQEFLNLLTIPEPLWVKVYLTRFRHAVEGFAHGMGWAMGEWCVCWDDDNLSHPQRLAWQLERTTADLPSVFGDSLYYFYDTRELFVTRYERPSGGPEMRCAAASLLFHRRAYPAVEVSIRGSWAVQVLSRLSRIQQYTVLTGSPWLFLVGANGDNWRFDHIHRDLGAKGPATLTRDELLGEAEVWENRLRGYRFDEEEVVVSGRDTQAFVATGMRRWPSGLASTVPPNNIEQRLPSMAFYQWQKQQNAIQKKK